MSEVKHTQGRIGRDGSFLWQMDSPSGAGMNLWSGKLSANNGYPEEHAIRAATLFEAAPDLLEALREVTQILDMVLGVAGGYPPGADGPAVKAKRAIAKATGES